MTRILLAAAGVTALLMTAGGQGLSPVPALPHAQHVAAGRHDMSPALRTLRPARFVRTEREREPQPWRRANRAQKLAFDPIVQNYPTAPAMPLPTQTIDGVGNVNGVLPPDTNGDVGRNHYVQWVNLSFAIYSKGTPTTPPALVYGPAAARTLWTGFGGPCEGQNDGDPVVLYDHLADRWVFSQLAVPNNIFGFLFAPFYQCLAISATADPTGSYYRYQFSFSKLNDYPKLGVWPDAYYMTMNQYSQISLQFAGQGVIAFDREKMLAGLPASMIYFDLASVDMNLGGMLPADLDGPAPPTGSPGYFAQIDDDAWGFGPDDVQLWKFHADWNTPTSSTFSSAARLPTAPFDSNLCDYSRTCIPQPDPTAKVDAMADRLMYRLQYRNFGTHESLVVNHTVDVDGTDHAGIRWYEIRDPGTTPVIYQQGTYAPDSDHRWMGSAAMDAAGNLALGFSVSGPATSPSVRYTGRLAGDPFGTMTQGETELVAGAGSQTNASGRWGDYSMLAVDPIDGCTFWYTQEYYASTSDIGWHTRIGSFSFPSCRSNPSASGVTVVASGARATENPLTNASFTVTRTGDLTAPLTVAYDVGGTATPDEDYIALPGIVTIPAGTATATIVVTPIDDTIVEANESVTLSIHPSPAYAVGSPSDAVVIIVSDDVPPDLVVSAVTAPATGGAAASVAITDTTKNQGPGAAAASKTAFYLSTNTLFDAADVLLGTRAVPALASGAADTATTNVTIPSTTTPGSYFVLAIADADNALVETQEANNVKASGSIRIGPDLLVPGLTVPEASAAGASIAIADTTANQGGGSTAASTTNFYLSNNGALDASDVLLGSRSVSALSAGASESGTTTVTLPASTTAGLWYVIAKADGPGAIAETQEANNQRTSLAIRVGPDLVLSSVVAPAITGAGATIVVSDTTKNQGAGSAPPSTTSFYWSADLTIDPFDVLLGTRAVGSLAPGAIDSGSISVQVPSSAATGTYFVIAKCDSASVVAESVEWNNTASSLVTRVGPDLTIAALTAPASAASGATITITDTTKNVGGGAADASTTRYYLSANGALDASDVLLGSRDVPALAAGASASGSASVTIPSGTAPGTYFIIAAADGGGIVVETSEWNNTWIFGIRVMQ